MLHATGEDQLIARAKEVFETMTGVKDDSVLAPDFRFEFPVVRVDLGRRAVNSPTLSLALRATLVRQVSLDKDKYLAAVRGFSLNSAIPNMNSNVWLG